jgi:2-hydroxy-6-oxonona-2,4-dienedioate hydrolase
MTMNKIIFKNEKGRAKLQEWYQVFLEKIEVPVTSMHVETSHGQNHLLLAGDENNPPLVCLHSMLTGSAHLLSEIQLLSKQYRLILPDLPGQSIKGIEKRLPYNDNSFTNWLGEILGALHLPKATLLGVSLGGFAALQFALNHPEKVENLILIVPAGIVRGDVFKGLAKMALPTVRYKMNPSDKNLRKVLHSLITTWDDDWVNYMGDTIQYFNPDLRVPPLAKDERLKTLDMSVLLIGAENDISFPGLPMINRVTSLIPNIETELIKNSNHCPPTTNEFRAWLANRTTNFLS